MYNEQQHPWVVHQYDRAADAMVSCIQLWTRVRRREKDMVAFAHVPRWSVEQYLEMERFSTIKHEFVAGYVYAITGGARAHNAISANLITLLRVGVRGGPCRVYTSDMKVRLTPTDYVYPNMLVSCDARDRGREGELSISYPMLAIEVLSDSTKAYDQDDKFTLLYVRNPALRDYMLVSAHTYAVEVHTRQAEGSWAIHTYGAGQSVRLESLGLVPPVRDIYEDIDI